MIWQERDTVTYRKEELITASEVARYVYCQRAWSYDRSSVRVRRRGFFRFIPSGRWTLSLIIVGLLVIVGLFIAFQMIGSGS